MNRRHVGLADGREVHVTAWDWPPGKRIQALVIGQKGAVQCRFDIDKTRALALAHTLRMAAEEVEDDEK